MSAQGHGKEVRRSQAQPQPAGSSRVSKHSLNNGAPCSENVSEMTNRSEKPVEIRTEAHVPEEVRRALVAEVRRRLESGELDSELAMVETALALLDGDRPG